MPQDFRLWELVQFVAIWFGVLVGAGIVLGMVHEIGHGIICWSERGSYYGFAISWSGAGEGRCIGQIEELFLYRLAGGVTATITAFGIVCLMTLPAGFKKVWLVGKRKPAVPIALVSLGVGHLASALFESFAFDYYANSMDPMWIIQVLMAAIFILGTVIFMKRVRLDQLVKD